MKLKYFISFFALVALLSSCSDDDAMTLLDEIQVSSSYVAIDEAGGSNTITLNAKESWMFDAEDIPEWLTVSPTSGGAGETKVTFSADAAPDGRTAILHVVCGDKKQIINVIQGLASTDIITVKEAIAMVQANQNIEKTVFVRGIVCKIDEISTQYGNATYYISDDGTFKGGYAPDGSGDGNWLEIYRGYWLNGDNFKSGDEFEVGDEMVITGVIMSYKGTPEIQQKTGQVVSYSKSLIKVDSLSTQEALPVEGGNVTAILTCKGNGISVSIPEEANDWLFISGITGNEVTLRALPNTGGDRNATVVFKTTDDKGKEYTAQATIYQKGSIVAATIAEFLEAPVGDTQYRITGVITKVANPTYGNVYISDWSGETYVYGIGAKGDFEAAGLKVGDVVTLVGKRGEHNGTAQMASATLEASIPVTPIDIDSFLDQPDDPNTYYMLTGTITEVVNPIYGNLYLEDDTNTTYVYGCYPGWGATGDNRKNCLETKGIAVGDKLSVIGVKSTYNGTPQLANGIYFSHEKAQ